MMPPPIVAACIGYGCMFAVAVLLLAWALVWGVGLVCGSVARVRAWQAVRSRPAWIPAAPKPPAPLPAPIPSRGWFEAAALPRRVVLAPSPADIENVLTEAARIYRAACTDH